MSFFGAILPGAEPFVAAPAAIRPVWFRPVALVLILALHAVLFFEFRAQPQILAPLDTVDVTLVPLGDSAADQQKIEESQPLPPPPPPEPPPAPQAAVETPPELSAPPPQVVAPEAVPLPAEPPKPVVKPKLQKPVAEKPVAEKPSRPTAEALRQEKYEKNLKIQEAAERRRKEKAQQAQQEARRGAAGEARAGGGMSSASYAGLLAAELRRHTFYPAAARAVGATGSVGVAFTVGPSGRVISQSVTRSSGNAALDSAAHAILSAIHTPPPPGGRFSTSTNLRFNFH
jgi:periplasmic protein TonB